MPRLSCIGTRYIPRTIESVLFFLLHSRLFVRNRLILNDLARRRRETISIDNIGAMKITVISLKRFQGVRPGRQLSRHARQTERD